MMLPRQPLDRTRPVAVALVGAGFVGRGIAHRLHRHPGISLACVVNRSATRARAALAAVGVAAEQVVESAAPAEASVAIAEGRTTIVTNAELLPELTGIDVVIEATGALQHGVAVMLAALESGRHVVSMNAEADALLGHHLDAVASRSGVIYSIADGDQPGVLLRLLDETHQLGLVPAVALNCKRNLDVRQNRAASQPYADRDGTSVAMTTAFGDGTKMHIENVVVANLTGLTPPPLGSPGVRTTLEQVADDVRTAGIPEGSVHFTLGGDFGGGVLVLARSDDPEFDAPYLRYSKLGDGPWYPLFRPYHLIHMEVATTIEQVATGGPGLGRRQPTPVARCAALAKRDLSPGQALDGIGGDDCYGVAVAEADAGDLLPVGLAASATLVRPVQADHPVALADVELDEQDPLVRLVEAAWTTAEHGDG
jgi:predicted homoserine dehydrogenase-like protein